MFKLHLAERVSEGASIFPALTSVRRRSPVRPSVAFHDDDDDGDVDVC